MKITDSTQHIYNILNAYILYAAYILNQRIYTQRSQAHTKMGHTTVLFSIHTHENLVYCARVNIMIAQ